MKENDELSLVELQRILLACCNFTVSAGTISSQWNAFSHSQKNVFLFRARSSSTEILAFPQRSISRSICVPVARSLLGYFCPVLYYVITVVENNKDIMKIMVHSEFNIYFLFHRNNFANHTSWLLWKSRLMRKKLAISHLVRKKRAEHKSRKYPLSPSQKSLAHTCIRLFSKLSSSLLSSSSSPAIPVRK